MPAARARFLHYAATVVATLTALPLLAQQPARYAVQRDTLRYQLDNPFRMYWARGADTIGDA